MDDTGWRTILAEWVNCLKVTRPILTLHDLQNEEFFISLTSALVSPIRMQSISDVVRFLQQSYPNFEFDELSCRNSLECGSVTALCSLLLHYSCIVRRNETFNKVLCNTLPQSAQLSIRTFLEKFACDMTRENFQVLISELDKVRSDESTYDWKPTGDSLLTGQSPLQNLLKTPRHAKEREQKRLRAELEFERSEKGECLDKIEKQKEKIKRLGNQLKEKCSTISRLRDELCSMQDTSLSNCQQLSISDTEIRLRSEIKTLECYISQLRAEQDELQDDKERVLNQLERSKEEAKLWQEKAVGAEASFNKLTEKYARQTHELGHLRMQCNEMCALLEEQRLSKRRSTGYSDSPLLLKHDSIMENSSEDLAHAIIEVQLKDAQKENAELQAMLTEAVRKGDALQTDLSRVTDDYRKLQTSFTDVQASNDELSAKVAELSEGQTKLRDRNEELNNRVCNLLKSNELKDDDLSVLRVKLENVSESHREITSLNEALRNDLRTEQSEKEELRGRLLSVGDDYANIRKEANELQRKYEAAKEDHNKTAFELNSWRASYESLDREMSVGLEKLTSVVLEDCGDIDFQDKASTFATVLKRARDREERQANEKASLQKVVLSSEQQIRVLEQEILSLARRETVNRQQLEESMKSAERNCDELRRVITGKSDEMERLNHVVAELNGTIEELSLLKDVIAEQDVRLREKWAEEEVSKNRVLELELAEEKTRQEKLDKEKLCNLLNLQVQGYVERIAHLEDDLSAANREHSEKVDELLNVERTRKQVQSEYETAKADLLKKNELVAETARKLEIELHVIVQEKENLRKQLEDLASEHRRTTEDRDAVLKEAERLRGQVKACMEQIKNMEEDCVQKDTIVSENGKELLNTKLELEAKRQAYRRLQESADKLTLDSKSYALCVDTLKAQNAEFGAKVNELSDEIVILNGLKAALEKRNKEFELNTENIIASLSATNEELNAAVRRLALDRQKSENELRNLRTLLEGADEKLEALTEERASVTRQYEVNIASLTEEVTLLKNETFDLKSREVRSLRDLTCTKDELGGAVSKYVDSLVLLQEVRWENECQITGLTENLHSVIVRYNELESSHRENAAELEEITARLREAEDEKLSLEAKLVRQKEKYEQELELTVEQLTGDMKNLSGKQSKAEAALEKANGALEEERGVRYRLENDVGRLQAKLGELEREKTELAETVDSLRRTGSQVEADYRALKITYGDHVTESENDMRRSVARYDSDLQKLKAEKDALRQQITVLENAMSSLEGENDANRRFHEETVKNNEVFMEELEAKISNHEANLARITEEQNLLRGQIAALQETKRRNEEEASAREGTIAKLKCACDILHTGKSKLEAEYKNLLRTNERIEQENAFNGAQLGEKLKLNAEEIANLSKEAETKRQTIAEKDAEIAELARELRRVKLALAALEDEAENSRGLHEACLSKIEEENRLKVAEMSDRLRATMRAHEELSREGDRLEAERSKLSVEAETSSEKLKRLEETVGERELRLGECAKKIALREETVAQQETLMARLRRDLQSHVERAQVLGEEKIKSEGELDKTRAVLAQLEKSYADVVESQEKTARENEENLLRAHEEAVKTKNLLLAQADKTADAENARAEIEDLLRRETETKERLEVQVLNMSSEKSRCARTYLTLKRSVRKIAELIREEEEEEAAAAAAADVEEEDDMKTATAEIERRIAEVYRKQRNASQMSAALREDKERAEAKLRELRSERATLEGEKQNLLRDYDALQGELGDLRKRYEENLEVNRAYESNNGELQRKISQLKENNVRGYDKYQEFAAEIKTYKDALAGVNRESAALEVVINNLRKNLLDVDVRKQRSEREEALEVIAEDVQKQFRRYSNILRRYQMGVSDVCLTVAGAILAEKSVDWRKLLGDVDVAEVSLKIEELKERASDALEQCKLSDEVKPAKESAPKQDDDWKKKCSVLKDKLVVSEHVRSNHEKKLRQLREEIERLKSTSATAEGDARYQALLQQNIRAKEEHIKVMKEANLKYEKLLREYERCKKPHGPVQAEQAEAPELRKIREAYGRVLNENIKLDRDRNTLQRTINSNDAERAALIDKSEKLAAVNRSLEFKVRALKEKEDSIVALKKEVDGARERENKRVLEIKIEYENKLERMKEKMTELYKNELQRKTEKASSENGVAQVKSDPESRRATIPKGFAMSVIREDSLPLGIGHTIKMEDEADLFNNKYLSDLKEGRCLVPEEAVESGKNRISELAWRNSLCPPHLKSSYPAETQFSAPNLFKEDDLKYGNVEFDDSLSSKLLPGEKPRKKDFGTTSYKKPGPPTPSKNGGRLSLQGSEQLHVLREHNETKTPKRSTPSRIKALFLGRGAQDNKENQSNTPRTRRLNSIFRKPR